MENAALTFGLGVPPVNYSYYAQVY